MTLGELLERSAARFPEKPAIIFKERQYTFQELNVYANRLGRMLKALGVQRGDKVGIMMPNCPEFVIGVFAALKAGAASVSINSLLQGSEVTHVINHSDANVMIAAPPYDMFLAMLRPKFPNIRHILTTDDDPDEEGLISIPSLIDRYEDSNLRPDVTLDDVASIYYTSGTTGLPKGAMLSHVNILSNCAAIIKAVQASRNDTLLTCLPLFHSFAMTACIMLPMFGGMTNVLLESFLPQPVLQGFNDWKVTFLLGVPTFYAVLANMPNVEQYDVSHFRIGFCGAAPLTPAIVEKFESKYPGRMYEGYGLSECSPVVSVNPMGQRKIGSIGKPLDERIRWRIVDSSGKEVPQGEIGEIIVKGPNVMKGYYKDEESTKDTIRNGWLHTGDLGYMDEDEFVFIADRKKDMIIVGGENVYPKEIEEVLTTYPAVQDAGVIGIDDPVRGEVPKAYIVPELGATIDEKDILDFCRKYLASFKIPRAIEVIQDIPRNATGKILKRALRRIAAGLPAEEDEEDFDEDDFDEEEDEFEAEEEEITTPFRAPAPSAPEYPEGASVGFEDLLRQLVMGIPGGIAGMLGGLDGIGIASFSTDPDFPTMVADAQLALVMTAFKRFTAVIAAGSPQEKCFVTDRYGVIMRPIGRYILSLVVEAGKLNLGLTKLHFEKLVPLIEKKLF
jgi:long-chain acyl-CoA synthetase